MKPPATLEEVRRLAISLAADGYNDFLPGNRSTAEQDPFRDLLGAFIVVEVYEVTEGVSDPKAAYHEALAALERARNQLADVVEVLRRECPFDDHEESAPRDSPAYVTCGTVACPTCQVPNNMTDTDSIRCGCGTRYKYDVDVDGKVSYSNVEPAPRRDEQ